MQNKIHKDLTNEYKKAVSCKECQFSDCKLGECTNFISCSDTGLKDCKEPCSKCLCWIGYGDSKETPVIKILKGK